MQSDNSKVLLIEKQMRKLLKTIQSEKIPPQQQQSTDESDILLMKLMQRYGIDNDALMQNVYSPTADYEQHITAYTKTKEKYLKLTLDYNNTKKYLDIPSLNKKSDLIEIIQVLNNFLKYQMTRYEEVLLTTSSHIEAYNQIIETQNKTLSKKFADSDELAKWFLDAYIKFIKQDEYKNYKHCEGDDPQKYSSKGLQPLAFAKSLSGKVSEILHKQLNPSTLEAIYNFFENTLKGKAPENTNSYIKAIIKQKEMKNFLKEISLVLTQPVVLQQLVAKQEEEKKQGDEGLFQQMIKKQLNEDIHKRHR